MTALSACATAPVWIAARFPTQDGPLTDLGVSALRSLAAGGSTWRGFYTPQMAWRFCGTLAPRFLLLASSVLSIYAAEKLLVALCVFALPPAVLYFLKRLNPAATVWALAAPSLALSWPIASGYLDYAVGLPLLFVVLGYTLGALDEADRGVHLRYAGLLLLLAFAHPLLPFVAAASILLWASIHTRTRRDLRELGTLALCSLPGVAAALPSMVRSLLGATPRAEHPATALALFLPHLAYAQRPLAWLLAGCVAVPVLALILRRLLRETISVAAGCVTVRFHRGQAIPALLAALAAAVLLLPNWGAGFSGGTARLMILFPLLALAWLPAPEPRSRGTVAAILAVISLTVAVVNVREVRRLGEMIDDYAAVGRRIPEGASVLPLDFNSPRVTGADLSPMMYAWAYLAIDRWVRVPPAPEKFRRPERVVAYDARSAADRTGIVVPDAAFAERAANGILACHCPESLVSCQQAREDAFDALVRYGRAFDRVLAWRPPAKFLASATASGYTVAYRSRDAALLVPPSPAALRR